jgi:hypothetical protein
VNGSNSIEVLDPIAPLAAAEIHLASRPRSLAGLTLAIVTSEGPNERELLEDLASRLVERQGVTTVRYRSRHGGGEYDSVRGTVTPAKQEPWAALAKKSDVAIVGVGL